MAVATELTKEAARKGIRFGSNSRKMICRGAAPERRKRSTKLTLAQAQYLRPNDSGRVHPGGRGDDQPIINGVTNENEAAIMIRIASGGIVKPISTVLRINPSRGPPM